MNQKKCPKCGENNPAEAVMCWACYTPLSGGATVAAGATMAAPGAAVAGNQEGEKKAVAPWQIGLVVGVLLLGLGYGGYSMMGSPTEDVTIRGNATDDVGRGPGPGADNYGPGPSGPAPPAFNPDPGGVSGAPIAAIPIPYEMVSAPNVNTAWGVAAIVPNKPGTSPSAAASLAKFARTNQFNNVKSWQGMQIFVFQDRESAQLFNEYQVQRSAARMEPGDYAQLGNIWPKCLAVYEFRNGGGEKVMRPSTNPNNWWKSR